MQTIKSLLVALALLQASWLVAQSSIGIRAGVNYATISEVQEIIDPSIKPEHIVGMNFAVYTELGLAEKFAIQPEINFLQKGSEISGLDLEGQSQFNLKVVTNYLEVPVLAKMRFGTNRVKGFAMLGPSVGYAIGGKVTYDVHNNTFKEDLDFDTNIDDDGQKDQRWDVSAVMGAGAEVKAGPGSVVLDLRYAMDFTDFTKFKDGTPANYEKSYNRNFSLSLGYQIPLMKS